MKKNSSNSIIYCIFPSWLNHSGHEGSYLDSLKLFSNKVSKKLFLVLPKKNKSIFLKTDYKKNLEYYSTGYISLLFKIKKNCESLKNLFKKKKLSENDIIFIDGYSFDFLLSLILSLRTLDHGGSFLVYCRYDYKIIKKVLFKLFITIICKKFKNLKILTDTYDLKIKLNKIYKNKVILLPVPHTHVKDYKNKKKNYNKYNLFFPGQFRPEKFGENFDNFLKINNKSLYRIFINENFSWNEKKNFEIKYLKYNLTRNNYLKYFFNSQIVILPYSQELYKDRTSGIFIESIVLNKIVLVTNGTWMSKELKKYKLNEFIVKDWSNFILDKKIKNLFADQVQKKIHKMQKNYLNFHNKEKYTNLLKKFS